MIRVFLKRICDAKRERICICGVDIQSSPDCCIVHQFNDGLAPDAFWNAHFSVISKGGDVRSPTLIVDIHVIEVKHLSVQVAHKGGALSCDEVKIVKDHACIVTLQLLHSSVSSSRDHHPVVCHLHCCGVHIILIICKTITYQETSQINFIIIRIQIVIFNSLGE